MNANKAVVKLLQTEGNGYRMVSDDRNIDFNDMVLFSTTVSLYVAEPIHSLQVFSDTFNQVLTLQKNGDHEYLLLMPNGKHALILVAIPGSPLLTVADYIRNQFQVDVTSMFADLSTLEGCCELHRKVTKAGLSVDCLVNNAGIGNTNPFGDKSIDFYNTQIGINVLAPTLLSRLFLPDMMRHPKPAILNVSSLTSFFANPNKQVYGATKSYLLAFSKALHYEMESTGLRISVVCPGGMNTRLPIILATKERHGISRWSMMNPENVAAVTVAAFLSGTTVIISGRWNKLFLAIDRILPIVLKRRIIKKQISNAETFEDHHRASPFALLSSGSRPRMRPNGCI